jgi:hypothetical protein
MELVAPNTYKYNQLRKQFPEHTIFYQKYISGGYYDKSVILVYDKDKILLGEDASYKGNYA